MTSLTFGVDAVIDLCSDDPIGPSGYIFEASSAEDGTDWGNPEAVVTEIQSQLLDGSLGKITSFGNRTATVALRIIAVDMDALAVAEAVLMSEVYRDGWNQLVWTPPASSVSTVFDVIYGDLQFKLDDLNENRCIRNYTLTLTCLPRPRSADRVSVASLPAPPATPNTVTLAIASSATGWVDDHGDPANLATDGVWVAGQASVPNLSMTWTGSPISMAATPYLVLSGTHGQAYPSSMMFAINGAVVTPISQSITPGMFDGTWRAVLYVAASSVSSLAIAMTSGGQTLAKDLKLTDADRTDTNPDVASTPRQAARSIPVYGSARTQGSLRIETSDASLGSHTLVFSAPPTLSGFQPPLRPHRVGGPATTSDSTAVSGSTNELATSQGSADHWAITASALNPATYELYVYVSVVSKKTVTLSWQAGSAASGTPIVTGSRTVTLVAGYQWVSVGSVELPTARVYAGSDDTVNLYAWASATGVTIDDGYLFSGDGHLAIVDTTSCSLLLLDSASIDEPEATVWVGKAAGSSGGDPNVDTGVVYAGNRAQAWEQHEFKPPTTNVFVVTPGTTQAQVSMTYYPRWGHHAGQVPG